MNNEISRNPSDYSPTTHAKQRVRYRGIAWADISETIRTGDLVQSHKDDCWLFIQRFEQYDHPIKVVVDVNNSVVITAVKCYKSKAERRDVWDRELP